MDGIILLYYKYVTITNPQEIMLWLRGLCTRLNLKGRIIIGTEGINGTVGGSAEEIESFKAAFLAHPLFGDVDLKESPGSAADFPRLSIKVRNEIVALGINPDQLTAADAGERLSPEDVHLLIENNKDLVILDTRNDYESRIGAFRNAVTPTLKSFRDFPRYIDDNLEKFKDKEVLMYCTGGIRCERATAYLNVKKVAKKVYHINGGICRYVEQYPDGFFRGKNYVFDDRIALKVNDDILTNCDICKKPSDVYANCMNASCNSQFIGCRQCFERYEYMCSSACYEAVKQGLHKMRAQRIVAALDRETVVP